MTIIEAMRDPNLFGPWFRDWSTWYAWTGFLKALFGLPMTDDELVGFRRLTGRTSAPTSPAAEAWLICGRRAGKSFVLALIAVYLACFRSYRPHLAPGERATILVIACDRRQARVIIRYIRALLLDVPMLAKLVERTTADAFDLTNGVTIEVATASFRTTRGYSLAAALCDELAFWLSDGSAEPDFEVLDALRPGMATIPGAMLLCASSPYARRGALWQAYRRHYGQDGDPVLVWKAPTRTMNPSVPQRVVDDARARDASSAAAEWLAEFRTDVEGFAPLEVVERCIERSCRERPFERGHRYHGFVDPSGGSNDSMTLAIAHREDDKVLIDATREAVPPFSPSRVVDDFAKVLATYHVSTICGDRYAGEWPREGFRKRGIVYDPAAEPKNTLYVNLLPRLNAGSIVLLDDDRLVRQIVGLERRTTRGGRDSIDHGPGGHDDLVNCVAGASWLAGGRGSKGDTFTAAVAGLY